jgi:S-adenosylmethionine hydrolase
MSTEAHGVLAPTVVFASDYGLADPYVGLCHLAIARVGAALGARIDVVDLCHVAPAFDVGANAALLRDALPWIPAGGVVLAVVDPGVGTDRAGVVVRVDGSVAATPADGADTPGVGPLYLVGPDNGLLTAAGGEHLRRAWRIQEVDRPAQAAGEPAPATFDGRDVFAPVAARLAVDANAALDGLEPMGVDELVAHRLPAATAHPGRVETQVVRVDGYGNVLLSALGSAIAQAGWQRGQSVSVATAQGVWLATVAVAFAELGQGRLGLLADAFGRLQLAIDRGDASQRLGLGVGSRLAVETAEA